MKYLVLLFFFSASAMRTSKKLNYTKELFWSLKKSYRGHHIEVLFLKELIDKGADISAVRENKRPLYIALEANHTAAFTMLLEMDANPEGCLTIAIEREDLPLCEKLLKKGADPNSSKYCMYTPLQQALKSNLYNIAELLVTSGADVTLANTNQDTALHFAAATDNLELIALLIAKGADVNARNNKKETPLFFAAREGYIETVLFLLVKGAKTYLTNIQGKTPADLVPEFQTLRVFKKLFTQLVEHKRLEQVLKC